MWTAKKNSKFNKLRNVTADIFRERYAKYPSSTVNAIYNLKKKFELVRQLVSRGNLQIIYHDLILCAGETVTKKNIFATILSKSRANICS